MNLGSGGLHSVKVKIFAEQPDLYILFIFKKNLSDTCQSLISEMNLYVE